MAEPKLEDQKIQRRKKVTLLLIMLLFLLVLPPLAFMIPDEEPLPELARLTAVPMATVASIPSTPTLTPTPRSAEAAASAPDPVKTDDARLPIPGNEAATEFEPPQDVTLTPAVNRQPRASSLATVTETATVKYSMVATMLARLTASPIATRGFTSAPASLPTASSTTTRPPATATAIPTSARISPAQTAESLSSPATTVTEAELTATRSITTGPTAELTGGGGEPAPAGTKVSETAVIAETPAAAIATPAAVEDEEIEVETEQPGRPEQDTAERSAAGLPVDSGQTAPGEVSSGQAPAEPDLSDPVEDGPPPDGLPTTGVRVDPDSLLLIGLAGGMLLTLLLIGGRALRPE